MKVLIIGGDGYIGWPLALRLSKKEHQVLIVDNFVRRNIDDELGVSSLTPIESLDHRLEVWNKEFQPIAPISHKFLDASKDHEELTKLLKDFSPSAIFHLAEYKSAPYSMRSAGHKMLTIGHNVNAANCILSSIIESKIKTHLIHIGTMGVYGYSGDNKTFIPEGYINAELEYDNYKEKRKILFPFNPGSIYHLSKTLDNLIFQFYNKNDGLKITDLHQGIVWGSQTPETMLDDVLVNRFDYDGDYGTVLNRFLIEAAVNHPLTVHGTGGQTRAFININDSIKCLELAMLNPPEEESELRIFNQLAETKQIDSLAKQIAKITGAQINYIDNPRKEAQSNNLNAKNESLIKLGLNPMLLNDTLLKDLFLFAKQYSNRCDISKIPSLPKWSNNNL